MSYKYIYYGGALDIVFLIHLKEEETMSLERPLKIFELSQVSVKNSSCRSGHAACLPDGRQVARAFPDPRPVRRI